MTGYARLLLITLVGLLAAFGGFNFVVDPYALNDWSVPGVNERRTRAHEDGLRVPVGDHLGRTQAQSVLLGSSRVVDGFPDRVETWPGGLYNAGMRGTNAFELAHAAALAGADANLRCLVIGLDINEFNAAEKFKPAFPVSRLSDGSRLLSRLRVALSPNTFMRSIQTIADNLTGGSDDFPFKDAYQPGQQRGWFLDTVRGYPAASTLRVDPARLDFLFAALERLSSSGVQVIGFLHPVHAFNEEALFATGREQTYFAFRREIAARFASLSGDPLAPCAPGGQGVLWDFAGFQPPALSALPAADQTRPHPTHHEPAHYVPALGLAMLGRIQARPVNATDFGVRLTPMNARPTADAIRARRAAYMAGDAGALLREAAGPYLDANPAAPSSAPLTPADLRGLDRLLDDVAMRRARLSRAEAS